MAARAHTANIPSPRHPSPAVPALPRCPGKRKCPDRAIIMAIFQDLFKILCAQLLADQQAPKSPSGVTGTALQGRLWVAVGRRSSTTSPCSTARSRLSLQHRHEMSSNSSLMRFYKHPSNLFHRRVHEKQSNSNFTESQMYGSLEYTYLEESTHNDISISLEIGLSQKQPHAGFSLACSTRKISSP